jgi:hypothetical protein
VQRQVPRRRQLAGRYADAAARALTAGNWVRSAAWSARAGLLLGLIGAAATGDAWPLAS